MSLEKIWVEKYRPNTITDVILPNSIKKLAEHYLTSDSYPSLIFTGTSGVGKTTLAKAILNDLDADYMTINSSLDNGIDVLRHEISNFASSVSFTGKKKFVILDEAERLTTNTQEALRNFMEEFSTNCGFILTCNYINRIIPALQSRCSTVDFTLKSDEKPEMALKFFKRVKKILDTEGVGYKPNVLAEVVQQYFPDFRKTINEIQKYSIETGGIIDEGILSSVLDTDVDEVISYMQKGDFASLRKWTAMNTDIDVSKLYKMLYDKLAEKVKPMSLPKVVLVLAEYQYKDAFVADKEINNTACFVEIMIESEWK